jgi:hypothetical protein
MTAALGTTSRRISSRFGVTCTFKLVTPVRLPPGRARLPTSPVATGSAPISKTIGIVGVADLAASAAGAPPGATITATGRAANSAAKEQPLRKSAQLAAGGDPTRLRISPRLGNRRWCRVLGERTTSTGLVERAISWVHLEPVAYRLDRQESGRPSAPGRSSLRRSADSR